MNKTIYQIKIAFVFSQYGVEFTSLLGRYQTLISTFITQLQVVTPD